MAIDNRNIPDLDQSEVDDLMAFWNKHQGGHNMRDLFPEGGKGAKRAKRATSDLANYASNKATAIGCRLRGDIDAAFNYERICERIYDGLPSFAKF